MSVSSVNKQSGSLNLIASRGQFVQYSVMPTASASIVNKIVQYTGTSTASYINGYFYKCEEVSTGVYGWTNISVQAGGSGGGAVDSVNGKTGTVILDAKDIGLQYDTMPTASVTYENQIVQYTGTTDANYTNGYFYKCVEDGGVYSWVLVADFALASDVYTKTQVGALTDLPDTSKNIVQNIDAINTAVGDKADKVSSATNGDLAGLDANGNLTDSGILATNVITKSNTSGLVKNDGTIDESTYLTPVSSATNGDLAGLDANGELTDSGILATNVIVKSNTAGLVKNDGTIDESTYLTSADIADKADVVSGATNGDLAGLDESGNLTDSGILATNVVTKVASATNGDLAGLNASGELTDSGILATDVITKSSTTGLVKNDGTIDESTYATTTDLGDKADKVTSATNGDLAGLDSNGDLTDSGILATNVVQKSSTSGLLKNDGTVDTNTYLTSTDISNKANIVSSATNGDLAGLDGNGDLTDSGIAATNVVVKSSTAGLIKNDGTIDTNTYATTSALGNKADKVTSATADDFATLDASGNLTDSGINKNIVPSGASSSNKLATANDLPTELNDLTDDVEITNPSNAQVLTYNSTSGKWENQTGSAPVGGATFKGSILFANLPTTGMVNGDWYDIKDAFTTDNRFEEGSGIDCGAGTDVIWVSNDSKWNILTPSGVFSFNGRTGAVTPASGDYSASDVGLGNVVNTGDSATPVSGGTTKFTTGGAYTELNKKADKVTGTFTSGHFASLNASGNIADSGKSASDFATDNQTFTQASTRANIASGESFSTIFGKIMKWFADLKDLAFIAKDGTSSTKYLRGDGTWQAFPSIPSAYTSNPEMDGTASAGTSSNYAKGDHRHPSDTSKADKVTGTFTSGNFAGLDANGNITDSGSKASDFSTVKSRQTPASGGTTLSLVNTGDMYTWNNKASTSTATTSANGLMSSTDKTILDNIATDCYQTSDTTDTSIVDADYVPFYDVSATAHKKITWENIKIVLRAYFDNIYATISKTLASLDDTSINTSTLASGQILEYNGTSWVNGDNISEFARYGGSKTFAQLNSSLLVAANVDKFFLITDGGTIASADASNWVLPAGSVIPADSHIAVIEYSAGVYKFDDFGGYVDISGKADRTELDTWSSTATVSSGAVSFSGINDTNNNAYDLYINVTSSSTNKNPTSTISSISGTGTSSMSISFTTDADNGATAKLRIIK